MTEEALFPLFGKGALTIVENITDYDKPFLTYEEQMDLMESRNIIIQNRDFTRRALSGLSYYTIINGYKNTFLSQIGSDNFIEGTKFDDLYTLHMIDTNLNTIILKYILFVERYLKTKLSYIISENYGVYTNIEDLSNCNPKDYLFRGNYSRSAYGRNNILLRIKETLTSNRINPSVAHYANDKNHIPAWILMTNLTFGLAIKWYSILKNDDKARLCTEFIPESDISISDKKEFITIAFSLLREYRNRIAHSNRTFNVTGLPVLPKRQLLTLSRNALSPDEYNKNFGKSDLFAVILVCFILIDDRYILSNFLRDLIYILDPYKTIVMNRSTILKILGLPENLNDRLKQLLLEKFSDINVNQNNIERT